MLAMFFIFLGVIIIIFFFGGFWVLGLVMNSVELKSRVWVVPVMKSVKETLR